MALDSATVLSLFSALLAVSAVLDSLKVGNFWLKVIASALSFLSSLVPLLIKLYVFLKNKQTRRLLIYKAVQKFLFSDYYEELNFYLWARGMSVYCNIFCENRSYVVGEFNVISKRENLFDLEEGNINNPVASHTNEREIDFGYISDSEMRLSGKTYADDEESRKSYTTERVYFQDTRGNDFKATLILKNIQVDGTTLERGQYFLRGLTKTDQIGEWDENRFSFMYYPKRIEKTEIGDVRIESEFYPTERRLRFKVRNLSFPQGLLTPWVNDATTENFIGSILVVEYMDEKGWIEWEKEKRVTRRGAHIFHAVNLTDAVIKLKTGYKLYEINHLTYNQPVYIE